MIIAASGGVRLEAAESELRLHAPGPAAGWPAKWLTDARWWRVMREFEHLGTPPSIDYADFSRLLREGFRFPVIFGGWSPLTVAIDESGPPEFLLGEVAVEVERAGRYIRRPGSESAWLLDDPTWLVLDCAPVLRRDLAVEANAQLRGELLRLEVIYSEWGSHREATRTGWVEQRHVENWSGPVTPLCGRIGVRQGLPVRMGGTGVPLIREGYRGDDTAIRPSILQSMSRGELEAVIACAFVWRGFSVVLPADACWLSGAVFAVRDDAATVIWLTDVCDRDTLTEVHQAVGRLRRLCPATYTTGVVARGTASPATKELGARWGIRVRDPYELANLVAANPFPESALLWAASARCVSPGETLQTLRQAWMVP